MPERFDINDLMGPVKDQGERQTCAAFAVAAAAEAAFARDTGQRVVLSEEYLLHKIYGHMARPADETSDLGVMTDITRKHGFALDEDWPYQPRICATGVTEPGCPLTPEDTAAIDQKADRLRYRDWKGAMLDALYHDRDPFGRRQRYLAGLIWRERAAPIFTTVLPADGEGWADDGMLSFPESLRRLSRGQIEAMPKHMAVLTGFDFARREFTFKNSWGRDWGRDGYGTIPFALIDSKAFHLTIVHAARPRKPAVIGSPTDSGM
jgi:hypothetical protein